MAESILIKVKRQVVNKKNNKQLIQFLPRKESACSTREGKIHVCP